MFMDQKIQHFEDITHLFINNAISIKITTV